METRNKKTLAKRARRDKRLWKCLCSDECKKLVKHSFAVYAQGHAPHSLLSKATKAKIALSWKDPKVKAMKVAAMKAAWANPKIRALHEASWADVNVKAKHSAGLRKAFSSVEAKRNLSKIRKKMWKDPTYRKRMLVSLGTEALREFHRKNMLEKQAVGIIGGNCYTARWITTKKTGRVFCRSSWEINFSRLCDLSIDVKVCVSEPYRIQYKVAGIRHVYLPDRLVTFADGTRVLVEIKPRSKWWGINSEGNDRVTMQAKLDAARKFCRKNNIRFTILAQNDFKEFLFRSRKFKRRKGVRNYE